MKNIIRLFTVFALLVAMTGCTHNNGDIGSFFGKWKLTSVSAENVGEPNIDGTVFWDFQNTTIDMQLLQDNQEEIRVYGNWRSSGQTLFLEFPDADMPPLECLGLPASCELQILYGVGSTMTLVYHPTPEQSVTYKFIKY